MTEADITEAAVSDPRVVSSGATESSKPPAPQGVASAGSVAESIRRALDGPWGHVRDAIRNDANPGRFGPPGDLDLSLEDYRAYTKAQVLDLASLSAARDGVPASMGGTGDYGASVTAFEMLGHADLSLLVKAGVQFGLYGGAIVNLGTERHHTAYVPSMLDGSTMGCFAMTETGHGSDVQHLMTTATHDAATDELVINTPSIQARKDYIGNAARDARMAAVFAQLVTSDGTGHGVHCILVPVRDEGGRPMPGVTIGDCGRKAGLPGVDNGRLTFDHVRVPRTNLLNRYGNIDDSGAYTSPIENESRRFFTMLGTLVRGRVSVAGGSAAATRSALALALRYAEHRRQFGPPDSDDEVTLIRYRMHQRKLLPALATSYALLFAQNELVQMMHDVAAEGGADEEAQRALEARAAGIKAVATAHATATIQTCREACGGAGYLADNRLPALKADTDVFTTFEGDNTVLLQLVAKGLLTDFKESFGDMQTLGMIRFASRFAFESALERTPASAMIQRLMAKAADEEADNSERDRGRQLALFRDREKHMLEGVALRLSKAGKGDNDAFSVFNAAQDHLIGAAQAHVERVVLEAFVAGVEGCEDAEARELLEKVCDLYALSTIERSRAWYMEHARMAPTHSKAVIADVNRLCGEIAPQARTLVDAFGIPDAWLGAPALVSPLD